MNINNHLQQAILDYTNSLEMILGEVIEDISIYSSSESLNSIGTTQQRAILNEKRKLCLGLQDAKLQADKERDFYHAELTLQREENTRNEIKKHERLDMEIKNILNNYGHCADKLLEPNGQPIGIEAYKFNKNFPDKLKEYILNPMLKYTIGERRNDGIFDIFYDKMQEVNKWLKIYDGECSGASPHESFYIYIQAKHIFKFKQDVLNNVGITIALKEEGTDKYI